MTTVTTNRPATSPAPALPSTSTTFDLAVVGLGYVGLPLAQEAVASGLRVAGFDIDEARVEGLRAGRSAVDDISNRQVAEMTAAGFVAGTDERLLRRARAVVICVPTPLGADGGPDLTAVRSAVVTVGRNLQPGTLVVLESTTFPGTTEDIVAPILSEHSGLSAGTDFHLAFSPERVDPGNGTFGVRNTPKVVGGLTPACTDRATALYSAFVDRVVPVSSPREAETAKLLENTYRQVNIALVNELAQACHDLGIDVWDVIGAASTKPFGFQPFRPGVGVGGHCIPIDPMYLSAHLREQTGRPLRMAELAQEINVAMPSYVARRSQDLLNDAGVPLRGARVLLLGVAYKRDISDDRETPARPLAQALLSHGAQVEYHDPHVPEWGEPGVGRVDDEELRAAVAEADLVILVQKHSAYDLAGLAATAQRFFDTTGTLDQASDRL
ncbi:nucleotide sugar dehydrogenase [Isoptericola nanjingensis]|uniref:nucleotide sugar dehydrogenase n=1 Tax=Isoptericola TaxID=254250 RepID=UPI003D1FC561|nr:nucleotide sugar dehydrogenase [Isoptericola sp. QY 916]